MKRLGLAAVVLTFVRWYLLVTPLGLPFHLRDAIRLGFVGYLFQFASLGAVGGDLFKAAFLAHEQPRRRPEGTTTRLWTSNLSPIATVESLREERGSGSALHSPLVIPAHAERVGTADGISSERSGVLFVFNSV